MTLHIFLFYAKSIRRHLFGYVLSLKVKVIGAQLRTIKHSDQSQLLLFSVIFANTTWQQKYFLTRYIFKNVFCFFFTIYIYIYIYSKIIF